jgi:multidrug efflux pump subunit AcrA (membrane-fusion protein)
MASDDVLRVYVNVPQVYSRGMVPGVTAGITVPERPGKVFQGKIVRNAQAIDPAFRTLLVEVEVDNHDHQLFPGAYAQVHFKIDSGNPTLVLPVPTLMFRSEGLRVAVVRDGKARLIPITISRDDGKTVEVSEGLQPSDLVVQNPPDSIIDGEAVHVVAPESTTGSKTESKTGSKTDGAK